MLQENAQKKIPCEQHLIALGNATVDTGPPHAVPDWASLIVEGIEAMLFSVDTEWRFTYLNHQASVAMGQSPEALLGKVMWDVFPSLIGSSFEELYRQAVAKGRPGRLEDFSSTTQAWYDVQAYPIAEGLIIYFQDSTARKLAEDQIKRQAERARVQAKVSRALAEVTHDYQSTLDTATQQLAEIVGDGCIMYLISDDGNWLEHVALHHRDPAAAAFVRDILAGSVNQRVDEGLTGLAIQTGLPVLIPTISPEQLKSMTNSRHWSYFDRFAIFSALVAPLRATGRVIGVITMTRHVAGQPYTHDDQTLVQDLADRVAIAITNARLLQQVQRELAERVRAEEVLRRTQAQLLQSQKMESIGQLAGGIAHDFNNLLSVIIGYCEMMLWDLKETDPLYADMIEIQKAGNRAATLVRHILAFSRQQVLDPQVVNLNETVANLDTMLRRVIGEDIELVSMLTPQLDPVLVDPSQIEQVIVNLAVNARDAMPEGGKLTIETARAELDEQHTFAGDREVKAGSYVLLAVSDTGIGMDQAMQARVFEPFFTTKEPGKGTGLGLATVYGIVRQSEGYIWLDSQPAAGTTFKIYLPTMKDLPFTYPQASSDAFQSIALSPRSLERTGHGRTILVVEDDALVRALIHQVLSHAGYVIVEAHNGHEALKLLASYAGQIDVVLTDIVMPKMGGWALVDGLKQRWPELKILCMSGYSDRAMLRQGIAQQYDLFLQKPFTPATLLRAIAGVLKKAAV